MTNAEAVAIVAELSAYYRERIPSETLLLWAAEIERLPHYSAAQDAVRSLAREHDRMPPLSLLLDEYRRFHEHHQPLALDEPELTAEERAENVRKAKALTELVKGNIGLDEALAKVAEDKTEERERT